MKTQTTVSNQRLMLGRGWRRLAAGLPVAAILAAAACRPAGQLETRTFELSNLPPDEAYRLLEPYVYPDRDGVPGMMSSTHDAITVRELPENLRRIEAVLAEFDRPLQAVRLNFLLIEADGFTGSDAAIADVEEELRKLFSFRGYRLAARAALQTVEDGHVTQLLGDRGYQVAGRIHRLDVDGDGGSLTMDVELSNLFATTVTVPLGETVVIGSGQIPESYREDGSTVQAAILVVTPELVDARQR